MNNINITQFQNDILKWFNIHQRKLPWRETENPYFIWIAEVMLQQTQVKKVLPYYEKFIIKFPDIHKLSQAHLNDILKTWEGLGYYARAQNLHKAAKVVVQDLNSEIPSQYTDFRKLPGVGDYIAAAVLSQAFNAPHAVVDGNVKRVLSRIFCISTPVANSASKKTFEKYAKNLLVRKRSGAYNQAIMELGALICRPKNPSCMTCPVRLHCKAFQLDKQYLYPLTVKGKKIPEFQIVMGVIYHDHRFLIIQRKTSGLLGGLWEFPGGRVKNNQPTEQACMELIKQKVNISVNINKHLTRVKHAYSHFKINVDVFQCSYSTGEILLDGHIDYRWITFCEIEQFPFHTAIHKIIPYLKDK